MKIFRFLTLITLTFIFSGANAQNNDSLVSDALSSSKKQNKKVFIEFYTDWCSNCKRFEKQTLNDESVKKELMNFVFVKINPEKSSDLFVKKNDKKRYPQFFILNENGEIVKTEEGFLNTKKLIEFLK